MYRMMGKVALMGALMLLGGVGYAEDFDLSGGATTIVDSADATVFIYNSDATDDFVTNDNNPGDTITIASDSEVWIGASEAGRSEGKVNVSLDAIDVNGQTLVVYGSEKTGQEGTVVKLNALEGSGNVDLTDSASSATARQNQMIVGTIDASGGDKLDITVGANSLLQVNGSSSLGGSGTAVNIFLSEDGSAGMGYLTFSSGTTIENGSIQGNGIIDGDVILDGADALLQASGQEQRYNGNVTVTQGKVIVQGIDSGAARMTIAGILGVGGSSNDSSVSVSGREDNHGLLTVGNLELRNGGKVDIGEYGQMTVGNGSGSTSLDHGIISLAGNGSVVFKNDVTAGGANGVDFRLSDTADAAHLTFEKGLAFKNGSITGTGRIDGDITLQGGSASLDATGAAQYYSGDVTIDAAGGHILAQGDASGSGSMTIAGTLSVDGGSSTVGVSGLGANRGALNVAGLVLSNNATIDVKAGGDLTVGNGSGTTTLSDGTVAVESTGTASFANAVVMGTGGKVDANGGTIAFAKSLTMNSGSEIEIANGGSGVFTGAVQMNTGSEISIDADSSAIFNNTVLMNSGSTIDIWGRAVFNGALTVKNGADLSQQGGADASFNGGLILDGGNYVVSGSGNVLAVGGEGLVLNEARSLTINAGSLHVMASGSGATISDPATGLVSVNADGAIELLGSSLHVGTLTLGDTVGNSIFASGSTGELHADSLYLSSGAATTLNTDVATTVTSYAAIDGTLTVNGNATAFEGDLAVNGTLRTDAGGADIAFGSATSGSTVFVNGGTLDASLGDIKLNASAPSRLVFNRTGNTVHGNVAADGFAIHVQGDLDVVGSGVLTGDTYSQTAGTVTGTVATTATDTATIAGASSFFAGNANFAGGANFLRGSTLVGVNNTIRGTGIFSVDPSSRIDLEKGGATVLGFNSATVNGTLRLGVTGGNANKLRVGNNTAVNGRFSVELGDGYITRYYGNADQVTEWYSTSNAFIVNGINTTMASRSWSLSNAFGDWTFSTGNEGAWLSGYTQTDVTSTGAVKGQLNKIWGQRIISDGFAANVGSAAQNILDPATGARARATRAGELNLEILKGFARNDTSITTAGGTTVRLDRGLLAAYNGSAAAGVTYVNQDVTREIVTTLHSRVADIRDLTKELNTIGSTEALGSMTVGECLNNQYLNRFWAGGLTMWQNASKRKQFDGYKYDGQGVIVGYDRAFGSSGAVIGGLSFAYMKGDYKDRSASSHDSEIKNYAVDAYMTYSACSGFFLTLMGGYNYGDNDIREMRGGNWATEDYHTNTWHAGGKLGYDFAPSDNFTMTPSVGANFVHSRANAHQMNLAGVNLLSYGKMKNHNVEIPVEMRMAYNMNITDDRDLTLMANGGWAYNLNDHGVVGDVGINDVYGTIPMRAVGRKLGHNAWNAGAGAKYRQGNWDATVKYDYTGRSQFHGHRLMGTVGYSF